MTRVPLLLRTRMSGPRSFLMLHRAQFWAVCINSFCFTIYIYFLVYPSFKLKIKKNLTIFFHNFKINPLSFSFFLLPFPLSPPLTLLTLHSPSSLPSLKPTNPFSSSSSSPSLPLSLLLVFFLSFSSSFSSSSMFSRSETNTSGQEK